MPRFNESSALLFKRCIEAGIDSPAELANIMGNASVETDGFRTMHERLGYSSVDNAHRSTDQSALYDYLQVAEYALLRVCERANALVGYLFVAKLQ